MTKPISMTETVSPLLHERYLRTVHKSGLQICIFPKKLTCAVACLAVRYGSNDICFYTESSNTPIRTPAGVAHFLEHKLFENEDGSDTGEVFASLGADANAYTTYNRTVYLFNTTEHFDEALEELVRFVTHPHFTDATVKKEQGIITEEIREYNDSPWERCFQNLLTALYRKHPVREQICGTVGSIRKITPSLLYDCYNTFYRPENMVLVVCGDVDADAVLKIVDRTLPAAISQKAVRRAEIAEPPEPQADRHDECMPVAKPLFCIGIKDTTLPADPELRLRRELSLNLLCEILFSRSDRFYNTLFEEGILTASYSYGYSCGEGFAFVCISGEADDPDLVLSRMWSYLDELRKNGIDEEALERCRRTMYADELRAYDSTDEIAGRLLSFALDGTELFSCPTLLQSISREELQALLEEVFVRERTSISRILPENDQQKGTDQI